RRLHDDRDGNAALAHRLKHGEPAHSWHDQIEHDGRDVAAPRAVQHCQRGFPAFGQQDLVSGLGERGFEQPSLYRIVIDCENGGHWFFGVSQNGFLTGRAGSDWHSFRLTMRAGGEEFFSGATCVDCEEVEQWARAAPGRHPVRNEQRGGTQPPKRRSAPCRNGTWPISILAWTRRSWSATCSVPRTNRSLSRRRGRASSPPRRARVRRAGSARRFASTKNSRS